MRVIFTRNALHDYMRFKCLLSTIRRALENAPLDSRGQSHECTWHIMHSRGALVQKSSPATVKINTSLSCQHSHFSIDISFMFHHGIVTFSDSGKLVIPNRLSRDQFLIKIRARLGESVIRNISEFLENGYDSRLKSIVPAVTRDLHSFSGDVHNYSESSMRNAINACFRTGYSRKIESEKIIPGSNLRPAIVIYDRDNVGVEFVLELKLAHWS